jgi:CSLREA domain-containing protein
MAALVLPSLKNLVIAIAMIISTILEPGVAATTYNVTTLADENDHSCSDGDCSLRDAIELSSDGSTVQFSVTGTISLTNTLAINKNLTIAGPGANMLILDGHNAMRVITVTADPTATVTISGLTVANGSSGGSFGGGISSGSHLVLEKMNFTNNRSSGDGGAIFSQGELTVTNTNFDSNQAGNGGAIKLSFSSVVISASAFTNNQATSNDGGAIYTNGSSGLPVSIQLTRCTFRQNKAVRSGGAIKTDPYTTATILDSIFTNNVVDYGAFNSQGNGGAISNTGSMAVNRSTFDHNQAGTVTTTNNRAGAIYTNHPLEITNSTFFSNKVSGAGGALFYATSSAIGTLANTTLYNNDLLGVGSGRGIYTEYPTVTVKNTIVGGPGNANCGATFTVESTNNLSTGGCSGGFATVTVPQLNLTWKGWYLLPAPDSVAIDTGTNTGCPTTDQRSWPRPIDGDGSGGAICDIGSIESTPVFIEVFLPVILH